MRYCRNVLVALKYFLLSVSSGVLSFGAAPLPKECRRGQPRRNRREVCREAIALILASKLASVQPAAAAETVGKDVDCNDSSCLGVWDGLLADCPHHKLRGNAGCTSSQYDTPGIFSEPWDFSEAPSNTLEWERQMQLLVPAIQRVSSRRGDGVDVVAQFARYLRVLFTDGKTGEQSIGEFYFTPNDTTVQFRVSTTSSSAGVLSSSLRNMERCEMIRKELHYQKLPVLRNRNRAFFFGESEWDTFGPGSAALGPPAEMKTGDLDGRQDMEPKFKFDLLQGFPRAVQ